MTDITLIRIRETGLTNIEMDSGPPGAVQTGEHSRSLLANEITIAYFLAAMAWSTLW